ncbi:hypothetical protein FCM35_KLT20057 [Carex littledalei]|uniref:Uncharacterized protein n=1 Tax=Carex littledalei TaxID=544730 RepID=A0A833VP81_9POAL|nr:hypothetical protein FCM35_KLT20057 [Carex littledalei]
MANEMGEIPVRCFFVMQDARCNRPDNSQVVSFCGCPGTDICLKSERQINDIMVLDEKNLRERRQPDSIELELKKIERESEREPDVEELSKGDLGGSGVEAEDETDG